MTNSLFFYFIRQHIEMLVNAILWLIESGAEKHE